MVARDEDAAVGWGGVEVEVAVKGVARGRMSLRCKYPRVLCLANTKKNFLRTDYKIILRSCAAAGI